MSERRAFADTELSGLKECFVVTESEIGWAKTVWNYMKLNHTLEKSDLILALCSYDVRVADRAAELWFDGMADTIMFSGNSGSLTTGIWTEPEAEVFRKRALQMGVPEGRILTETKARNTGENIKLSFQMLQNMNRIPKKVILVQKPYMERRAYATFMKQWPGDLNDITVYVTSPSIELEQYPNEVTGSLSDVITVLVGDMERIKFYETLEFQIPQVVPDNVQRDFDKLKRTGKYTRHMPNV